MYGESFKYLFPFNGLPPPATSLDSCLPTHRSTTICASVRNIRRNPICLVSSRIVKVGRIDWVGCVLRVCGYSRNQLPNKIDEPSVGQACRWRHRLVKRGLVTIFELWEV